VILTNKQLFCGFIMNNDVSKIIWRLLCDRRSYVIWHNVLLFCIYSCEDLVLFYFVTQQKVQTRPRYWL